MMLYSYFGVLFLLQRFSYKVQYLSMNCFLKFENQYPAILLPQVLRMLKILLPTRVISVDVAAIGCARARICDCTRFQIVVIMLTVVIETELTVVVFTMIVYFDFSHEAERSWETMRIYSLMAQVFQMIPLTMIL